MQRGPILTAIDLGTDKCVTLIATISPDSHQLQVLGVSAIPSKGMRKSQIVDLEEVLLTMTESLDAAERMAGIEVHSAVVSISGTQISSQNSKGVVAVAAPTQEITIEDVNRVLEAARAISLPTAREIIHVIPRHFAVDSQQGIKDPIGMTGVRLESEAHIITAQTTALRNITKLVQDLGLQVEHFMFSGLASAEVMLTETEKELGVVLIDIGAGSTSVCAYVEGSVAYSSVLPIGARHITQDIALGCRMSLESAEKIKIALSESDFNSLKPVPGESKEELRRRRKQDDELDIQKLGIYEQMEPLSKRTLIEGIMVPRMKEMFTLIAKDLQKEHLFPLIPAGVVLSGGGAGTVGMVEVAKRTLNLSARVGRPVELRGLIDDIQKPSYATAIGLLVHAQRSKKVTSAGSGLIFDLKLPVFREMQLAKVPQKLLAFFKSLLP